MNAWKQLTIHISEADRWQHQPLYQEVLGIAHQQGVAGVTVVQAIAGYGKQGVFRTTNLLDPSSESSALPLLMTVIDREENIAEFLASAQEMLEGKVIICQTVEVLQGF